MKFDKETLVKYQFWFLLGTFLIVWLVGVFWLKFAAAGPIEKAKKDYDGAASSLKTASQNPVNESAWCLPWVKYGTVFSNHKGEIWGDAWKLQKDMYDWPREFSEKHDMSTPQTVLLDDERDQYKTDLYKAQMKELHYLTEPGPDCLIGPAELKGGFDEVVKPQKWKETPTREEIWLAQEDFWVKRELLWDIHNALLLQSFMYPDVIDEKKEPMPEGVLHRFRYHNQNWEVTLNIRKDDEGQPTIGWDSTIKNLHPSRMAQPLISAKGTGIIFNLTQGETRRQIMVQGEPVPPEGTQMFDKDKRNYKASDLVGIDWSKAKDKEKDAENAIYLSQAFDESTCPIRRIDAIALGLQAQSCRTFTTPLQPNETLAKLDAPKQDPNANQGGAGMGGGGMAGGPGMAGGGGIAGGPGKGGGPGMAGGGGMTGGPGMAGGKGMQGGPAMPGGFGMRGQREGGTLKPQNPTPNNEIERNRYLQPSKKADAKDEAEKPSRHLPLAIQLIVEQSHIPDVEVALANSRLRIQITQILAHRVYDYKPQAGTDGKGVGNEMRTFNGPDAMMYRRAMQNQRAALGSMPPGGGRGSAGGMRGMAPGGMNTMPRMVPGMGTARGKNARKGDKIGLPGLPGGMPWRPMPTMGDEKTSKSQSEGGDGNLMEVTIYGIATLYRLPDTKSESADQAGQPAPAAPPPGGKR